MKQQIIFLAIVFLVVACSKTYDLPPIVESSGWKTKTIEPYPQSLEGHPDSGFYYLTNGAYLGTGLPYDLMKKRIERLEARGLNQTLLRKRWRRIKFAPPHL